MGTSSGLCAANVIEQLLSAPHQFDFAQAMELLEACDPEGSAFGHGLERRVRLLPDDNLVFPASDIRGCHQGPYQLTLMLGFFGLYGVDAPVPHYLLDRTTAEDDDAARMRDFLNIFNPRFYSLLYRAIQISRPAAGRLPASFRGCADAVSGRIGSGDESRKQEDTERRYFPVTRIRSVGGLQTLLQDRLPGIGVSVHDRQPAWQALGNGCVLGRNDCALGDSAILGGKAYMANGNVAVRVGPVDSRAAKELLPGHQQGDQLRQQINNYLQGQVGAELQIRVCPSRRNCVGLGSEEQHLGWSTWLGERLQQEYVIRVAPETARH